MQPKTKKILIFFFLFLFIIPFCVFKKIERSNYKERDYYKRMMVRLDSFQGEKPSEGDTMKVGWSKKSLLFEKKKLPLAGYGVRKGNVYETVKDSIFVRTLFFTNGKKEISIVSLELLIVPPEVSIALKEKLHEKGFSFKDVFLTATHTHNSIGAWAKGLVGELFAGSFDPEVVHFITERIIESMVDAKKKKEISQIGFGSINAEELVYNRLVDSLGTKDPFIRIIKIENRSGEKALFTSFAAHATILSPFFMGVSGDYPGMVCSEIEKDENIDFCLFAAGAVGSQGYALEKSVVTDTDLEAYSKLVSRKIQTLSAQIDLSYVHSLTTGKVKIELPEASPKISKDYALKEWVFHQVFGNYDAYISYCMIDKNLFIGTPCDFSGELVAHLDTISQKTGSNLIITSFNGGYVGYITKDIWYDKDSYETRTMNWYGTENGKYFSDIITTIIQKNNSQ
ncbi:MAG: neutral/alkaline non-lysosomal ceramidase N-terminal domain-containing protein [Chitinophagaceae bacterium]|nr:neutral/alkaline non-lysosomal ceramidase N-terminal domain-containing protein [Chitinophagaceae bacterium]